MLMRSMAIVLVLAAQDPKPPEGAPAQVLRLDGQEYEIYVETKQPPKDEDYLAYQVCLEQEAVYWLYARNGGITRIADPVSKATLALVSPDLAENRRAVPLADLVWETYLSTQWMKKGDALTKEAARRTAPPEAFCAAYERALHPFLITPHVYSRLGKPYVNLFQNADLPREMLAAAATRLALLPKPPDAKAAGPDFALARGCAYFFLRCYPRAAEALRHARAAGDAEGLRKVLRMIGGQEWSPLGQRTIGTASLSVWKADGKPGDPALPVLETCYVAEGEGALRTFTVSKQSVGGQEGIFLHCAWGGAEQLVEAFGPTAPPAEDVERRIADFLRSSPAPAPAPLVPAPRRLPPLVKGDPGRVEVIWGGASRTERVELRREGLEAAVWLGMADGSPTMIAGLTPGKYTALLRDARGRIIGEREITVEAGTKLVVDADRF